MMIMCYERSSETVRMKNKPIGCGLKVWKLCEANYIFSVFSHSNKYPWYNCQNYKDILPPASAVVATLAD